MDPEDDAFIVSMVENVESILQTPSPVFNKSAAGSSSTPVQNQELEYIGYDKHGSNCSFIFQSPKGTRFWDPDVAVHLKPTIGMLFAKWDEVVQIKQGKPSRQNSVDTMRDSNLRSTTFKVTNCEARIKLKIIKGTSTYVLYGFLERHNHSLVSSDTMDLTKKGRNLNFDDLQFIHRMSLNKIGPTIAHRLQSVLKGGHHNMRGSHIDFKNVSHDIRVFIGERDARMVIDRLTERRTNLPGLSFEFFEVNGELRSLFWCDEVSKLNYEAFGEVLAFDATYSTNKYKMIFVPFSGVEHHKRCVTFGAVHRLCLWHIMKKLPLKISGDLLANSNIKSSIHKLILNVYITPEVFEDRWRLLMDEFNLQDHVWLNDMLAIRDHWVPPYFREIPMCCLMKTTSRCESSNALFKVNSSGSNTLVHFLMCFDTAIDQQRYNQRVFEHRSMTTTRQFKTRLPIKKDASYVYSQAILYEVQKEIHKACDFCFMHNAEVVDSKNVHTIAHANKRFDILESLSGYPRFD